MILNIFIPGIPRPAGSKRAIPIYRGKKGQARTFTGHSVVVDTSGQKGKDWRADVRAMVQKERAGAPLETGSLTVFMTFYLPRPKSHFGTGKNATVLKEKAPDFYEHLYTPDALKLGRAVEDSLTGVLWKDDCQVRGWYAKEWTENHPGLNLVVFRTSRNLIAVESEIAERIREVK